MHPSISRALLPAALFVAAISAQAAPQVIYSNGFESNIAGWDAFGGSFNPTRVASGTNGITSADGSFHGQAVAGVTPATNFGGYNYGAGSGVPTVFKEYTTSVDVFLDVGAGFANDTRFDYSSAINNAAGLFLRDFVFNAGFYNDLTGPGSGTNRFVISTGNNATRGSSFPKNAGAIAIATTGWYTFEHHFYENGGVLKVDMSIFDVADALVNTWTLGTDAIGSVGGNRYGWFVSNELRVLAIDNSSLQLDMAAVPEPGSLALAGLALALAGTLAARQRRKA